MEQNEDLAKGFTKRDKPLVESLWQQLADSLNSASPPQKGVNGWRKIWTEWKSEIKKRLAHNKTESRATGGGPFSKYQLTPSEEAIVRICGLDTQVGGVQGVPVGTESDIAESSAQVLETLDNTPSTSKRPPDYRSVQSTAKKARQESISERLIQFLDSDTEQKSELNQKLENLIEIEKENAISMQRIYEAIEKGNDTVAKAVTDFKEGFLRVSTQFLDVLREKNETEKRRLERKVKKESGKKH